MYRNNNNGCGCTPAPVTCCPPYVTCAPVAITYAGYQHTPFEFTVRSPGCGDGSLNDGYGYGDFNSGFGYGNRFSR